MFRRPILFLAVAAFVCSFNSSSADPPAPPRDKLPVARWNIEFSNGVKEVCEVHKDGTASVVEPLRSSTGTAEVKDGAIVLVFQDDRVERWTPVGARMIVEHWATSAGYPSQAPVRGIAEMAGTQGVEISLRLEREQYRADEPITLELVIKNTGTEVVDLGMSASDLSSFDFVVRYVGGGMTQGGRMPLTKYGTKLLQEVPAAKNILIQLKPGEQRPYRFALNRMIDLTLSGSYSVVVNRTFPAQQRHDAQGRLQPGLSPLDELTSNELFVGITEPPTPNR